MEQKSQSSVISGQSYLTHSTQRAPSPFTSFSPINEEYGTLQDLYALKFS